MNFFLKIFACIFASIKKNPYLCTIKITNNRAAQLDKLCTEDMTTIAESIKYPEFREQYRGQLITGHLVRIDGMYYRHSKRVVTEMTYDELDEYCKSKVAEYEENLKAMAEQMAEVRKELRAKNALIAWAMENAHEVGKSNQSESEYYHVRHTDGRGYTIRVSGHRYPTGSMTDLMLGNIDTTDHCCAKYCDMLGIEY